MTDAATRAKTARQTSSGPVSQVPSQPIAEPVSPGMSAARTRSVSMDDPLISTMELCTIAASAELVVNTPLMRRTARASTVPITSRRSRKARRIASGGTKTE